MRRNKFNLTIKLTIGMIIVFLTSFFIVGYIWNFLKISDYFNVTDVITRTKALVDLSYLKGKNIFSIDLKNESKFLLESHPNFSKVRIIRILPNRIFVDFIRRKPVAYVKLYRYFALDKDGVLFYAQEQPQDSDLPIIVGLETKIFGPKPGKKYNIKEILLALDIIKEVKDNRILKIYNIKKIDVASSTNTTIFMHFLAKTQNYPKTIAFNSGDLEIKIGQDDIKKKIFILAGLVTQAKNNLANMKYIDLRFLQPVIKFKNEK